MGLGKFWFGTTCVLVLWTFFINIVRARQTKVSITLPIVGVIMTSGFISLIITGIYWAFRGLLWN